VDDDCDGTCDNGFACCQGAIEHCTIAGSTGTRVCGSSCTWGACTPTSEICNGEDDDGDSYIDEDFQCAKGSTVSCTTICGTTGTGTCTDTCTLPLPPACTPPDEICNGFDDDCDELIDEGFPCHPGDSVECDTVCGAPGEGECTDECEPPDGSSDCYPMAGYCCTNEDCTDGCKGEPVPCYHYPDQYSCNDQPHCHWNISSMCFGNSTMTCGLFYSLADCVACGCEWNTDSEGCSGEINCEMLSSSGDIIECLACGCGYGDPPPCTGYSSTRCSSFTSQADCEMCGCTWIDDSCSGPGWATGCEGFGDGPTCSTCGCEWACQNTSATESCMDLSDPAICGSYPGCYWSVCEESSHTCS
jgi:hypothetical protein